MKDDFSQDHYVVESKAAESGAPGWIGRFVRTTFPKVVALFLLCYLVYGHVHIVFTRSESGWMLESAQSWGRTHELFRWLTTHSYYGHYVPLFFLFEMLSAKVCGINENFWRVHQFAFVILLMLALLSFFSWTAKALAQGTSTRFWIAAGLTAPLIFSPLMIEFVGWPFEAGQLLWAALTVYSLALVSRSIDRGVDGRVALRDLGFSLACAYGSLHVFGLGAATMAGWLAVWMVLFLDGWLGGASGNYLKKLGATGGIALALTAVHGSLMLFLPRFGTSSPPSGIKLGSYVAQTLGYFSCLLWGSLRSLWGPNSWPYPRPEFVGKDWVYGLGTVLALAACGVLWFRSQRARPSAFKLGRLCWHVFSLAAFTAYVLMVSLRIRHQGESWLGYLLGPRYLWPGALLLFGFFASFVSTLQRRNPRTLAVLGLLVAGTSVAGNMVYQSQVIPKVWPWTTISHEQSWRRIAAMEAELRQASLPVPDLGLIKLGYEFNTPLRRFEPLIRSLAGRTDEAPFDWVEEGQISPELWHTMKLGSPALVQLSKQVFVDEETAMKLPVPDSSVSPILVPDSSVAPKEIPGTSLLDPGTLKSTVLEHIKDQPHLGVPITITRVTRPSLWLNPPTSLVYPNVVLGQQPVFRSFVAIHPGVYKERSADGAVFQVDVRVDGQTTRLKELYIDPFIHPELRRWTLLEVDLSKYAGRTVDLVLSNSPGPKGNDYADWCIWGDPKLADAK